jgi:hypothetical protein
MAFKEPTEAVRRATPGIAFLDPALADQLRESSRTARQCNGLKPCTSQPLHDLTLIVIWRGHFLALSLSSVQ